MSLLLLAALFICGHVLAQTQQPAIPSTFFGMHVNDPRISNGGNETSYPLQVTYGQFRNWDVWHVSWPDIETCEANSGNPDDTCFGSGGNAANFKPLQYELQQLNSAGVGNVMLTLSRTPAWAVTTQQAADSSCNYYNSNNPQYGGACYAPNGPTGQSHLNTDGTGSDLIWRNSVMAIATYVSNYGQTWCGTNCANVKYWSIWNEFDRNNPDTAAVSWYALTGTEPNREPCSLAPCPTPDQLMRMTQVAQLHHSGHRLH